MSAKQNIRGLLIGASLMASLVSLPLLHAAATTSESNKEKAKFLINNALKKSSEGDEIFYGILLDKAWELDSTDVYLRYLRGMGNMDPSAAVEMMRPYYQKNADDPYIATPFIGALLEAELKDEAYAAMQRLVDVMPENMELRQLQCRLYADNDSLDGVMRTIRTMQSLGMSDIDALSYKLAYFADREPVDSAAILNVMREYMSSHPDDSRMLPMYVSTLFLFDNQEEARVRGERLLQDKPDDFSVLMTLAGLEFEAGNTTVARDYLMRGISAPEADLMQIVGTVMNARNDTLMPVVDAVYSKLTPENPLLESAAYVYFMLSDYEKVDSILERHPDLKLSNAAGVYGAVYSEIFLNKPEKALRYYEKAKADRVEDTSGYGMAIPNIYASLGDVDKFMSARDTLLGIFLPGVGDYDNLKPFPYADFSFDVVKAEHLYSMEAELFLKKGDRERTLRAARNAVMLDPKSAEALNNYAYFISLASDNPEELGEALEMSQNSILHYPDENKFDTLAWILFKLGRYEDARKIMEVLVDNVDLSDSGSWAFPDHLGDIYFKCGNSEGAMEMWKTALLLNPKNENIAQKVETGNYIPAPFGK